MFAIRTSAVLSAASSIVKLSGSSGQQRCCFEKNGYCAAQNPKTGAFPKEKGGESAQSIFTQIFVGQKKSYGKPFVPTVSCQRFKCIAEVIFFVYVCGNF